MEISADARIGFPRDLVFSTYRDRLPELVPHLPNVDSIAVKSREENTGGIAGQLKLVNLWKAKGDIPKVARAVVKPEMLTWHDYAEWNQDDWSCAWRIELGLFTENVRCQGVNRYEEVEGGTLLKIRGQLDINLKGIPGVPRLLAGRIAPAVEKFIVSLVTPNLTSVADGLQAFLRAEAG